MGEHTPGPWKWTIVPRFRDIRLENNAGLVVMDFARWGMQGAQPRFRGRLDIMWGIDELIVGATHADITEASWPHADARLIAAAPDLLEIAKVVADWPHKPGEHPLVDMARAAIAKALGQKD